MPMSEVNTFWVAKVKTVDTDLQTTTEIPIQGDFQREQYALGLHPGNNATVFLDSKHVYNFLLCYDWLKFWRHKLYLSSKIYLQYEKFSQSPIEQFKKMILPSNTRNTDNDAYFIPTYTKTRWKHYVMMHHALDIAMYLTCSGGVCSVFVLIVYLQVSRSLSN